MSRYSYVEGRDSVCCADNPVNYWWVNGPTLKNDQAVEKVVDEIEKLLSDWDWNEWELDTELGVISDHLVRAMQGKLAPLDEVKPLDGPRVFKLFEIRISIDAKKITRMQGRAVGRRHEEILIRIYHAEERNLPNDVLGLHWHRKQIIEGDPGETSDLQDKEIDTAITILEHGRGARWNLQP